jgi:hypothetical protein
MIRLCDKHPKPHLYIFTGSAKKQWEESTMTIYEVETTVVETCWNYPKLSPLSVIMFDAGAWVSGRKGYFGYDSSCQPSIVGQGVVIPG